MNKEKINLVWLKRDLRLHDNEAISRAIKNGKRFLIFYAFEKILINDPHYNSRHWNFIKQSLVDLNSELKEHQSKILSVASDVIGLCNQIQNFYTIETIYSHQETGILTTYTRDKEFKRYCRNNNIDWKENVNNGVQRGLKHRENWFDEWEIFMNKKIEVFNPLDNQLLNIDDILTLENISNPAVLETSTNEKFQRGGRSLGYRYLNSFFKERHKDYMFNISKPNSSRTSCSRLSPYLAWGNLSVREVFQMGRREKTKKNAKHIGAFLSRLRWQAHFIQKFETTSLELGGSYISRSEIYSDLFNLNLGIYFTKVENTHFLIKAEYFQSLQEPNNQEFVISEFPSFESYLNMQFGLNVHFDKFELQFDYNYVPWGKSYWVMNRLNTSFHYFIK